MEYSSFILKLVHIITILAISKAQLVFEDDAEQDKISSVGGRIIVQAAGASFPNRLYQDAVFAYQFENSSVLTSYRSTGSSKGKCRITNYFDECKNPYPGAPNAGTDQIHPYFVDFAGSDSTLSEATYTTYPDIQMYPACAGAVVPVYNLPLPAGETLVLTPLVLAKIFRNAIDQWNDPEILVQNSPEIQAALNAMSDHTITVVVREDGSGTSEIWKKSLSQFDPIYLSQIGESSSNANYNATVVKQDGNQGVAAFVQQNTGSIGYSVLGEAKTLDLDFASLNKGANPNEAIVSATVESVDNAVFEKGLQFDAPVERQVADINNALGSQAWPIVGYTYFVLRKDTLRPGATCENRYATVKFLEWFYVDPEIKQIAQELGFSVLPINVREVILNNLRTQILCEGVQVWIPPVDTTLKPKVYIPEFYEPFFTLFKLTYQSINPQIVLNEEVYTETESLIPSIIAGSGVGFVLGNEHLVNLNSGLISLPYGAVGMGAIFNLCGASGLDSCPFKNSQDTGIRMNIETLAGVLDGTIQSWNDTALQILNPNTTLPEESIIVFGQRNNELRTKFENSLREFKSNFDIDSAVQVSELFNTSEQLRSAVASTPFSIGYTPVTGNFEAVKLFKFVDVIRPGFANAVTPNAASVAACGLDTFVDTEKKPSFNLRESKNVNCYPLVESLNIVTKGSYSSDCSLGVATTEFTGFLYQNVLFSDATDVEVPLESQNIGPLASVNSAIQSATKEILFDITCDGSSILNPPEEKNLIDVALLGVAYALFVLHIVLSLYFSYMVHVHRKKHIIRNASPNFLQLAIFGGLLGMSAIIPLSLQDGEDEQLDQNGLQEYLDLACQSSSFLYTFGFVILYSAVWLKTWRLHKLFNNPRLIKRKIYNKRLHIIQAVFLAVVFFINILWLFLDPLRFERVQSGPLESYAYCTSDYWYVFITFLSAVMVGALMYGLYLLYTIWFIPNDFNESKWISFSLITAFQSLILAVPILFLSGDNPTVRYIIFLFVAFATMMVPILFLLLPKILEAKEMNSSFDRWNSTSLLSDRKYGSDRSARHGSGSGSGVYVYSRSSDRKSFSSSSDQKSFQMDPKNIYAGLKTNIKSNKQAKNEKENDDGYV